MSTPPRRSRPRKSDETIDSTAERLPNESLAPQTADAPGAPDAAEPGLSDPEARLGAQGSDAADNEAAKDAPALPDVEPAGVSVLGEPDAGDRNAPPAGDGTAAPLSGTDPDGTPGTGAADAPPLTPGGEAWRDEAWRDAEAAEGGAREGEPALSDASGKRDEPEPLDAETVLGGGGPHAAEPAPAELNYHETSPITPPPQGGAGFGTMLGAGLVGAALALLVGGGLQYAGVVPAVREPNTAELAQQFARAGDVQQLTTDLNTVRGDVGQLQSTIAAGGAGGAGPSVADFAALADRFNNLEGRVNGLAGAQNNGAPAIDPAAVQGATDAANGARTAAEGAQSQAAEARQTAQTAQQAAGTAQQAAEVAQQAANGAMETARVNGQAIEDIRNRIGSVEDANRRASVAIAAAGLKAAVDRGGPFMSELETYATAAGASPVVDALRNYAPAGVPGTRLLQDEWPGVRTAVLAALRPRDPNAGLGQQILSGLNSLVAVRPSAEAGAAGATGPDAIVARLDAAIAAGDLDAFDREWQGLPPDAKTASADFQKRVAARAEAERVVGEALAGAVNQTGTAN